MKKNIVLSTLALTACAATAHAQETTTASAFNNAIQNTDTLPQASNSVANNDVPISIENPTSNAEVNKIVYDVYIAKKLQGSAIVSYTNEWVEIDNIDDVIQQLRDTKNPALFQPLLTGKIPARTTRVTTGVGQVYVDTNNFALYVDIDQAQAALKKIDGPFEVETDNSSWSGQNALHLNTSTDSGSSEADPYNLTHETSITNGPWRLNFNGNVTNKTGYDVNTAVIELDKNAKRYSVGMLETKGTSFVSSVPFYGLQIRDNYDQLNTLNNFESAPLELYIPSRSKVTIYKNGSQLIYSETHAFGFQQISTLTFPSGSYDIKIKIEEQDGTITEETQPYNKNSSLTAFGHPSFNIQIGGLRENFDLQDGFVLQADYSKRLTDATEAKISVYGNQSLLAFEPQLRTSFNNEYSIDAGLNFTSDGDIALKGSLYRRKKDSPLDWFVTISQVLAGHSDTPTGTIKEYDNLTRLVAGSQSQMSAGLAYKYKDINLRLNGRQSTSDNSGTIYAYGPSVTWNMYKNGPHRVTAEARQTYTNSLDDTSLIATYAYTPQRGKINARANVGRIGVGGKYYNKTTQSINYNDLKNFGSGYSVQATNNYIKNTDQYSNSSQVEYTGRSDLFKVNAVYETITGETNGVKNNRERSNLTLTSNLVITKNGITPINNGTSGLDSSENTTKVLLTSKETLESGMIIDLKGNATGAAINILLNNNIVATAKVGQRISIDIPEYTNTVVSLSPVEEAGLLSFDSGDVEITLNPNTVFHKEWNINRVTIAMGRLIDLQGKPLKMQKIEGLTVRTITDASGYFQMELQGNEIPYLHNTKNNCTLALPRVKMKELLSNLGDIVCG